MSPAKPRRRKPAKHRTEEPSDWASYLEPIVREIQLAIEISRRIECAILLQGSPKPEDLFEAEEPSRHTGHWRYLARVRSAWELAADLSAADLEDLRREWNAELREWGMAIHERRGDTLRLRRRRASLLQAITFVQSSDPTLTDLGAARRLDAAAVSPGEPQPVRGDVLFEFHAFVGPHGTTLTDAEYDELMAETEKLRDHQPEDDRSIRRTLKGELKKSRGGVADLDPRLLRPKR